MSRNCRWQHELDQKKSPVNIVATLVISSSMRHRDSATTPISASALMLLHSQRQSHCLKVPDIPLHNVHIDHSGEQLALTTQNTGKISRYTQKIRRNRTRLAIRAQQTMPNTADTAHHITKLEHTWVPHSVISFDFPCFLVPLSIMVGRLSQRRSDSQRQEAPPKSPSRTCISRKLPYRFGPRWPS